MKQEIIDKMKTIKPELEEVSDTFLNKIRPHSFETGSYIFGVSNENSDIDIVIHPKSGVDMSFAIRSGCIYFFDLDGVGHYRQEDFESCYGIRQGTLYNFLIMHSVEAYEKWKYATNKLIEVIRDSDYFPIEDKEIRVKCFESLKAEYLNK